jgi:hypothetical protein
VTRWRRAGSLAREIAVLAEDVDKRKPKLHYKTQLFISARAVETMMPLPGWAPLVREYTIRRARQTAGEDATELWVGLEKEAEALAFAWWDGLSESERAEAIFFSPSAHRTRTTGARSWTVKSWWCWRTSLPWLRIWTSST